ncbi:hypothetical protein [Actinomadura rugatobispora]|uniref:Uncharacterized protein n=1 Tax=Actinomadura rugatobispora TaxID=1994 RepID=A0ABW0ZPB3_9ACTN|nr:hypothetical protein GCM10010200_093980 [Actinomadura rugatobispora]
MIDEVRSRMSRSSGAEREHGPQEAAVVIETLGPGDVLGWSWNPPSELRPHRVDDRYRSGEFGPGSADGSDDQTGRGRDSSQGVQEPGGERGGHLAA